MTQQTITSLYIENPAVGSVSSRGFVGDQADGIFGAIQEHLVPTEKRLLNLMGREREGTHFEVTEDIQVTKDGGGETHFVRKGEIVVYTVRGERH
ncbi:TPA: hypothetical protein QDA90_003484 [Burkholderia vietnamiensis]|uniref:hypothetical protein n=1 Tax=Burkholderia vietnamiensis TaxID=60552 RepID=UPI00298B9BCF|nr:hypothetical protein [Burkholderia vietnamiensis]